MYIFMAKRRTKKQKLQKQVLSGLLCVICLILAYFLEPWQYITENGDKTDVGTRTELTTTDLQVHYIDVGQADAILVRVPTSNGMKNMLIDAGTAENYPASNVTSYLSDLGITTLEYFVITVSISNILMTSSAAPIWSR